MVLRHGQSLILLYSRKQCQGSGEQPEKKATFPAAAMGDCQS